VKSSPRIGIRRRKRRKKGRKRRREETRKIKEMVENG
jgi:hypothetical protein